MRQYPDHCDCIVCGKPKAHLGYYSREDGRPVYVCPNCGAFFKLPKGGAAEVLDPLDALDKMPIIQNFSND